MHQHLSDLILSTTTTPGNHLPLVWDNNAVKQFNKIHVWLNILTPQITGPMNINIHINSHYRSEGLVKWYPNFMTLQYTYRTYLIRKNASYGVCSESESYPSLHPWYTSFLWATAGTKALAKTHQMRLTFLEEVKVETCGNQKGRMNKQTAVIICHVVLLFNFKQQFEPLPQHFCFLLKIRIRFSM